MSYKHYNIEAHYTYEYTTQVYVQIIRNHIYVTVNYNQTMCISNFNIKLLYKSLIQDYEQYFIKWFTFYHHVRDDGALKDVFRTMLSWYVALRLYE